MILGGEYSREQVHKIFSPATKFTPQTGTWGLHGIVSIPNRESDFVFFVTYGQSQGDHVFDEGITSDGVLSWQSQPSQHLQEARIKKLIVHDDQIDNIYLFLREKKSAPYSYLGRLGYITHDETRERPVWFQWQLLDWDEIPNGSAPSALSTISSSANAHVAPDEADSGDPLRFDSSPPAPRKRQTNEQTFKAIKAADYAAKDARNRQLGLQGELLVLASEKHRLLAEGREDLSNKVVHTSVEEGDGAGYDIASFRSDGSPLHIEVKTTRGGATTDFFMSPRELEYSRRYPEMYQLMRLYDWNDETGRARAYVLEGDVSKRVSAIPTNFRVKLA